MCIRDSSKQDSMVLIKQHMFCYGRLLRLAQTAIPVFADESFVAGFCSTFMYTFPQEHGTLCTPHEENGSLASCYCRCFWILCVSINRSTSTIQNSLCWYSFPGVCGLCCRATEDVRCVFGCNCLEVNINRLTTA